MTTDETIREIEALPDDMFLRTPNPDPDNRQFVYSPDLKALAAELKLYREFVGNAMMIQMKGDAVLEIDTDEHGDGKWHICDDWGYITPPGYDTAIEAFDVWRKMQK